MNTHDANLNPNSPEPTASEIAELEDQLRRALRPVDPPTGFADRVIARAGQRETRPARILNFPSLRSRLWIGSAIAAMLLVGIVTEESHRIEQRRRAEEAQRQFETALQVTDRTLDHVREQLSRTGVPFGQ